MSIKDAALTIEQALDKYGTDELIVIVTPDGVDMVTRDKVSDLNDLKEQIELKHGWIARIKRKK